MFSHEAVRIFNSGEPLYQASAAVLSGIGEVVFFYEGNPRLVRGIPLSNQVAFIYRAADDRLVMKVLDKTAPESEFDRLEGILGRELGEFMVVLHAGQKYEPKARIYSSQLTVN